MYENNLGEMSTMEMLYTYLGMVIKTILIVGFALLLKYDSQTKSIKLSSRLKFYSGVTLLLAAILFNLGAKSYFGWNTIAESSTEIAAIFASGVIYFTGLGFIVAGLFYNKNKEVSYTQEPQV
jgi:hypothetical protein